VEEEMMAEYDDDDEQDILHIDDITKLYSQNRVSKILNFLNRSVVDNLVVWRILCLLTILFFRMKHKNQTIF